MHTLIAAIKPSRTGGLLSRLTWVGSFLFILFCAVAILTWINPDYGSSNPDEAPNATLRAAPGNNWVQMFDTLIERPNEKVTIFDDGFRCTKLSDLLRVGEGPHAMYFYKLNCGGKIGYVNKNWVRNY